MQLLADYLPLILFFVAFKLQGIFVATAVAMVASVAQIAWFRWKRGRVQPVHWLSLVIIVVFGGATLILQDELFIKWKPTVLYWLFAVILGGARLLFQRNLLSGLMGDLKLPPLIWTRLTWTWTVFFLFMGVLNLYVAFNFPTETWVNFKVWGSLILMAVFVVGQGLLLARHLPEQS